MALEEKWEAMLGNDKKMDPSLFLFLPKKIHFELLLVIYYASVVVVNCSST